MWSECLCPLPNSYAEILVLNVMMVLGHGILGRNHMNKMNTLRKGTPESLFLSSTLWEHNEKSLTQRKSPIQPCRHLIWDFQPPEL